MARTKPAESAALPFAAATADTRALALAKLASSGLDEQDALSLGLAALEAQTTRLLGSNFAFVPSLQLPYWDPRQPAAALVAAPKWPQFYRVRYLMPAPPLKTGDKPPKYMQAAGPGVCAYFPRLSNLNWPELLADASQALIITEGELKAAKACKEGFPAIGLGGVNSSKSRSLGHNFLLPELKAVNWVGRYVYIIFDSDLATNPNVVMALNDLAVVLADEGALPMFLCLPTIEGVEKTGLDDFLVNRPAEQLADLLKTQSCPITSAKDLFGLNERVAYVANPGVIVELKSLEPMVSQKFHESHYATAKYEAKTVLASGKVSHDKVGLTKAWLAWPLRHERGRLTYAPGRPKLMDAAGVDPAMINTWPGWGVEPKKGDVKPFLKLIDHLFTGAEPGVKEWFLQWCAYPLAHPGTKLFTAVIFYGLHHGTGKSQVGYTLGRIYGKNFSEIKQGDLHAGFNSWAEKKQFILADDITGSTKREDADVLKKMITQKTLRVNSKYVPEYELPDCLNYLFTSNSIDALFLEDSDRRYFVHEIKVKPLDEEFYLDYDAWLNHQGGAAALFHYLLNLPGLDEFNPSAPAMRTKAKERMTMDGLSDLGAWVRQLRDAPETILRLGEMKLPADLYSNKELLSLFDPSGSGRISAAGMGRELTRAGIRQANDGATIAVGSLRDRFYIVRNPEIWEKATMVEVRAHLSQHKATK